MDPSFRETCWDCWRAVWTHWRFIVTGSVLAVVLAGLGISGKIKQVPWWAWIAVLAATVVIAQFLAWRDLYRKDRQRATKAETLTRIAECIAVGTDIEVGLRVAGWVAWVQRGPSPPGAVAPESLTVAGRGSTEAQRRWTNETARFLSDAVGPDAAALFLTDAGLPRPPVDYLDFGNSRAEAERWVDLQRRTLRLLEIMKQVRET